MPENIAVIRAFVYSHVNDKVIDDREDIFETNYVSSMFAVQALAWTEKTFNLAIMSEDLVIDNFRSIESIAAFVDRKRAVA